MKLFQSSLAESPALLSPMAVGEAITVRTVQSGDADREELCLAEQLVKQSFGAGFRDHDWRHGLGGTHIFINDHTNNLLAHAAVVSRVIRRGTDTLLTGYVEAVAVRPDLQGRGLGRVLMDQVESIVSANYQLGALNAIDNAVPFYLHRGWTLWTGPTAAIDSSGNVHQVTNSADRIMLFSSALHNRKSDHDVVLTCDWRPGDLW